MKSDGSKAAAVSWKSLQGRHPTPEERMIWFGGNNNWGIALIPGLVSGNIEVMDFDHKAEDTFGKWMDLVEKQDANLIKKLVIVITPRKGNGFHVLYRCSKIAASHHLAKEIINGKEEILIETRGEGSYILTVGCPGACHETGGTYEFVEGCDFASIPTITPEEREILHSCARQLDLMPDDVTGRAGKGASNKSSDRPGDDFNRRATWAEIIEPHGWQFVRTRAEVVHWRKPGSKGEGIHATTNHLEIDRLHVFSSSALPFEAGKRYSKFAAYAILNYGGDFSAAAKDLAAQGYGSRSADEPVDWSDPANWESPISFESTEPPTLTPDFLPGSIRDFVEAVVANTQTPVDMATLTVLSVLATAAQKKFVVADDRGYKEPLSLYTMVLLPSASRKSAVHELLCEPLDLWESNAKMKTAPLIALQADMKAISELQLTSLHKLAASEADSTKKQRIIGEIRNIKTNQLPVVTAPELYCTDTTPEAFVDFLANNEGRGAVISDEGNILDIMTGLYVSDSRANLDVFLKGHAGGCVKVKRKSSDACIIKNVAVSLGLCVQPDVFTGISSKGQKRLRGKGLFARILFAFPNHNLGTRDVRTRLSIPEAVSNRYNAIVTTLLDLKVPNKDSKPPSITLSADANELWQDFCQLVETKLDDHGEFADMRDWAGKLAGAVFRISGLVELANVIEKNQSLQGDIEISGSTMAAVIEFAWLLSQHAKLVFNTAGESPAVADARWISNHFCDFIETAASGARFVNRNSVHHNSRFSTNSIETLETAFRVLVDRNIVSPLVPLRTGNKKPKLIHYLNPCWTQSKSACLQFEMGL